MKKGLLGGTALVSAAAILGGAAMAAEAPTWKLTGNANFQFYWVDQDNTKVTDTWDEIGFPPDATTWVGAEFTKYDIDGTGRQDHDWYFGVDEAELQLNVSGTADNGLNYGFKIEINANTTDNTVVDE
ncbi:MAG: hypothetical protein IMF08_00015, partial [Proteobacteria bacterium]|nr:hypothetical protein [Pseudomonadota bacterium]